MSIDGTQFPEPTPITDTSLKAFVWRGYWREYIYERPDTANDLEELKEAIQKYAQPGDIVKICRCERTEIDSLEVPNG